jgi:deoxyribodipyrimidine photolyase-related protein
MSNYCAACRCDPARRVGENACPFTTLYRDFLARHERRLGRNPRMALQFRNLRRLDEDERRAIQRQAARVREAVAGA